MVRRTVTALVSLLLFSAMLVPGTAAQKSLGQLGTPSKICSGLHAGIRAQIIPPYTETPSVMLSFVLLNDSDAPIDVEAGSWSIVIDGSELKNSGDIFGKWTDARRRLPHPKAGPVIRIGEVASNRGVLPSKWRT